MGSAENRHARHVAYGLSCSGFADLEERAAGRCEICRTKPHHAIDHDHALGLIFVRGLLCHACNIQLDPIDKGRRRPTAKQASYLADPWHLLNPPNGAQRARKPLMLIKAIRMLPALWAQVEELCHELDLNPSDAVREALVEWVKARSS